MPLVNEFFEGIDRGWSDDQGEKIVLRVIGSAALMLRTGYERGTKDSDVLETDSVSGDIKTRLLDLAGEGSELHRQYRMYLDVVARGLPFLPQAPRCHPLVELNQGLRHFSLEVLDVVDVAVSKLKRFNANDRNDINAMVDRDLIGHAELLERFRSAVDRFSGDARAEDLPDYVKNLHRVERDFLLVPETEIELPDWIG